MVTSPPTVTDSCISIPSTGSGTGGVYKIGDTVTAKWDNTSAGDNQAGIAGVTMDFSAFGGGTAVAATSDANGNWTASYHITAGTIDATNRNVSVTATDNAGNTTTTADTTNATVDNTAPALTLDNVKISADTGFLSSDFITNSASQTITARLSGALAAGDILYGSTDDGATWTDITAKVSGTTLTWNGTTLAGSTIEFRVRDAAGNDGPLSTRSYTLDTSAPAETVANVTFSSDTGASSTDLITSTAAQDLGGTLTAPLGSGGGNIVYVSLDDGASWKIANTSVGLNTWSLPGQTLAGSGTIKVKVADYAGNESAVYSHAYVIDTVAPAITIANLALSDDTGASATDFVTNTASQTISATLDAALGAGDIVLGSLDNGATWTDITAKVSGTTLGWDGALLAGTSSIKLKVSDVAGNDGATTTQSYVLDKSAPAVPSVPDLAAADDKGISSSDNVTDVSTPAFTGTAEAGALVTLYDTDGVTVLGSGTADGAGNWSIQAASMSEGAHSVSASVTDAAGNTGPASSTLAVTIDTTRPTVSIASDKPALKAGETATVTITFSEDPGTSFTDSDVVVTGGTLNALSGNGLTRTAVFTPVANTDGGAASISIASNVWGDAAGNSAAANASRSLTFDTLPPAAPAAPALLSSSDTGVQGDGITWAASPVITGSALANAKVELSDGATVIATVTADTAGKWSTTASNLPLGDHSLTARQYDAAGNQSVASSAFALHIAARPAPPSTLIDGMPVTINPVVLPGGATGTAVDVPVVTSSRVESSGRPGVADIPLATANGSSILIAQVAPGYGLSARGGANAPATSSSAQLIPAIKAATPDHTSDDQGHLAGDGQSFLDTLQGSQSLLVETVVPTTGGQVAPNGTLSLNGSGAPGQHVALVIDSSHLPSGSTIELHNVDFAAAIGSANIVSDGSVQVLTGDAASQHFTVAPGGSGSVYAGGGDDTFTWGAPVAENGGDVRTDAVPGYGVTLLHGGQGIDSASFNGTRDSFNVEYHNGYEVVSSKAEPDAKALLVNVEQLKFSDGTVAVQAGADLTTIAGLYQGIYGRQADLYGFEFWADAHQKNGISWGKMAMFMIDQAEWTAHHDALNGNANHDVEVLYEALFSRKADGAGLDFWVGVMHQYGLTLEQVADYMVQSPEMNGHQRAATDWNFFV